MGTLQKPIMLDDTGKRIATSLERMATDNASAKESAIRAEQAAREAADMVEELEVKFASSLPDPLVDNTIYNIGNVSGTLAIPTAPNSTNGIRINFSVTGDAFAITFADTPKWLDSAPDLALTAGDYTLCILDGIYSLNETVEE